MTRMFNPPHPARMLAENLEYLGISASQFARHIGLAPSSITHLLREECPITPDMAVRISAAMLGLALKPGWQCRGITTLGKPNTE